MQKGVKSRKQPKSFELRKVKLYAGYIERRLYNEVQNKINDLLKQYR